MPENPPESMSPDLFTLMEAIARKQRELDALRRELVQLQGCTTLPSGEVTVLRCRLRGHAVALPVAEVLEVIRMPELTVLPDAFPWVMGLVSIASNRIPVVDLFGGETRRAADPDDFIVLAETQAGPIGLVMDAIENLVTFDSSKLSRPEPDVPFGAHVVGVFEADGDTVLLLSAAPIAAPPVPLEAQP